MKLFQASILITTLGHTMGNTKYKQSGSEVDKSKQIKKPTRQHGNAIIKQFKDTDEVSFKISSKDNVNVVMASDNDNLDYSIAEPGKSSFKKVDKMTEEGSPSAKKKEKVNGKEVDTQAIKLNHGKGGVLKVKAETKKILMTSRSLAESTAVAILKPDSPLNVCYETASLINYVGESVDVKISLCDTESGVVQSDDSGVLSGTFVTSSLPDDGGDGSTVSIPQSGDDGWSVVSFTPTNAGIYMFVIEIDASSEGETFERQSRGFIAVAEKQLDSVDLVSIGMEGDSAQMAVKVKLADGYLPSEGDAFIVSADIVDGMNQPVVTASAIADLGADSTLKVVIQPEWFQDADISSYSVEYLRISSVDSVPLVISENIAIDATTAIVHRRRLSESSEDRELRMTQGILPPQDEVADNGNLRRQLQTTNIIASHGYCSGDAWGDSLPGTSKFQDFNQNRSHREFAELLLDFGGGSDSDTACSIIAHSQGGPAALYLYTYYESCLDNNPSSGRRLIQSVGSPYQGTAIAGVLAGIGDVVFGAGCGPNIDMTYDGAANFLSGIPSWARSKVNYYTTSFEDYWFSYDYCEIVTDNILTNPSDGCTEQWAGQLDGANNMGHTTGQCHTRSMNQPGQTADMDRNNAMLAYAA